MTHIDTGRKDLVAEFMAKPIGRHSGDLRRLLNTLRMHPDAPPYILVCTVPQREWRLALKQPVRGAPVELLDEVYIDPLEAERRVFALRWLALTGEELGP